MLPRVSSRDIRHSPINLSCPKIYHRPIIENHGKNLIPTPKDISLAILSTAITNTGNILIRNRAQYRILVVAAFVSVNLLVETNNVGLGAVLASRLVSEPQDPPSLAEKFGTHI
jgi:hypothetical protein